MIAKFDRDAAQNEQPQNHHEWQGEAAEARGIGGRKREEQSAAARDQPYFVAVPYRSDRFKQSAPLAIVARDEEMYDSDTHIETIEHGKDCEHYREYPEPESIRRKLPPLNERRRRPRFGYVPGPQDRAQPQDKSGTGTVSRAQRTNP